MIKGLRRIRDALFGGSSQELETALHLPERWKPIDLSNAPPDGRLRVLVLSCMFPTPDAPVAAPFVLEQVQALRRAGVDARVISGRSFALRSERSVLGVLRAIIAFFRLHRAASTRWWELDGVPIRYLPFPSLVRFVPYSWAYRFSIWRNRHSLKEEFSPQILHAHSSHRDGALARKLAIYFKVPYILTEHSSFFARLMETPAARPQIVKALVDAARVIAVSSASKAKIASHPDFQSLPIDVIPNVLDIERFHPADSSPSSLSPLRLLYIGTWEARKNVPILLAALKIVREAKPDTKLRLVRANNNDEQIRDVMAALEELALGDAVHISGHADRGEVARLMRDECDIFVLASKWETFGCVVAEALASGRPAVITPCGGAEDIVTAPWMGEICLKNNDPESLAQAILSVANRLETFDPRRLRQHVVEHFSSSGVAGRIIALYRDVLGPTGLGPTGRAP